MNPAATDASAAAALAAAERASPERAAPPDTAPSTAQSRAASSRAGIARLTSEQLFAGATEVQIDHHGAVYRLKQTSLGKLILTK